MITYNHTTGKNEYNSLCVYLLAYLFGHEHQEQGGYKSHALTISHNRIIHSIRFQHIEQRLLPVRSNVSNSAISKICIFYVSMTALSLRGHLLWVDR